MNFRGASKTFHSIQRAYFDTSKFRTRSDFIDNIFALNDIYYESTNPMPLIFCMKTCLVDLFQIYPNGAPGI